VHRAVLPIVILCLCIGKDVQHMKIMLGNCQLEQCQDFVYLGGNISQDASCDKDVIRRIGLAAGIVRSLRQIWKAKDISKSTKVLLYKTLVQSIIFRKICGITRKDRRRNVDILKELSAEKDIVDLLQVQRLTYFGHVNRMDNHTFPKLLLHGYTHGHRWRGRPKNKWLDNIWEDWEDMNMSVLQASCLSWDRTKWRNTVHNLGCRNARTVSSSPRP